MARNKKNKAVVAEQSEPTPSVTVAPYSKATPARKDGKTGPDPKALAEGRINPLREGKVWDAIRAGAGSTVAELVAATGLRDVTVRYFGISAGEAGILDAIRIGSEYRFVVAADDTKASDKAKAVRAAVIAMRDQAKEAPATTK
jgi:ribosomal protein L13E